MQDLLEWFDYALKDIGEQPGQWIEFNQIKAMELEDRYPPSDTVNLV